jgi:hypothetical protein
MAKTKRESSGTVVTTADTVQLTERSCEELRAALAFRE